jgi:hypothetical protein
MIRMLKEKKEVFIRLRQEQHMKVNGLVDLEMATEFNNGQMEQDTKVNGETIELTEKESLRTSMVTFMKETGSMTRQTDMEYITI